MKSAPAIPNDCCPVCTKDLESDGWCFECRAYPRQDRSAAQTSDGWTGTLYPSLRCDYCGDEVVGSDAPSLDSAKEAHRENCPERTAATLYVQAKNVKVGDVIDGVPISHKSVHEEFVWLSTDDGRSMKLAHSYLIPVDRRPA